MGRRAHDRAVAVGFASAVGRAARPRTRRVVSSLGGSEGAARPSPTRRAATVLGPRVARRPVSVVAHAGGDALPGRVVPRTGWVDPRRGAGGCAAGTPLALRSCAHRLRRPAHPLNRPAGGAGAGGPGVSAFVASCHRALLPRQPP
eukprot:1017693-Pleurochrysis_carterae.AAC.1